MYCGSILATVALKGKVLSNPDFVMPTCSISQRKKDLVLHIKDSQNPFPLGYNIFIFGTFFYSHLTHEDTVWKSQLLILFPRPSLLQIIQQNSTWYSAIASENGYSSGKSTSTFICQILPPFLFICQILPPFLHVF
jgi:hypothetical protein